MDPRGPVLLPGQFTARMPPMGQARGLTASQSGVMVGSTVQVSAYRARFALLLPTDNQRESAL